MMYLGRPFENFPVWYAEKGATRLAFHAVQDALELDGTNYVDTGLSDTMVDHLRSNRLGPQEPARSRASLFYTEVVQLAFHNMCKRNMRSVQTYAPVFFELSAGELALHFMTEGVRMSGPPDKRWGERLYDLRKGLWSYCDKDDDIQTSQLAPKLIERALDIVASGLRDTWSYSGRTGEV